MTNAASLPLTGRLLICVWSIVSPRSEVVVSTNGVMPVTVTSAVTAPGVSVMSTRVVCSTWTVLCVETSFLKPLASTVTLYWPGLRFGNV